MLSSASIYITFASIYNSIDIFLRNFIYECQQIWYAFQVVLSPKSYIFFENSPAPYWTSQVNPTASGSAVPEWIYLDNSRCFIEWDSAEKDVHQQSKALPILSLEVIHKDKVIYDLTEFLEGIRVYNTKNAYPSLQHIIGAWSLSSGIVLDMWRGFEYRIICNQANTHIVDSMCGTEGIHEVISPKKTAEVTAPTEVTELPESPQEEAKEGKEEDADVSEYDD